MAKILHIWNTAGIGSIIANEQRNQGHKTRVLMRHPYDPFGFTEYYGFDYMATDANRFLNRAFKIAKDYDIIHFHGISRLLFNYRQAFPDKVLIMHHHGTEVTKKPHDTERLFHTKYADIVLSSTMDVHDQLRLEGIKNTYIPNPIDTDIFKPIEISKPKKKYLYVSSRYIDMDNVFKFLSDKIDVEQMDVFDREQHGVPFYEMPKLLNQYETFVDVKCYEWLNGEPGRAYSTTGLQSSACGLNVINYNGDLVKDIHQKHTATNAVNTIMELVNNRIKN